MEHDWVAYDWIAYDPQDLGTHPEDGAVIETWYENGSHGLVVYSRAGGGIFKGFAFNARMAPTRLERWRYA